MDPNTQMPVQPDQSVASAVSPELSQEQMKANLQDLFSKVESKYQQFNTQKFASNNKIDQMSKDALKEVFDQMVSMGIDPSNVDQVNAFMDQLKTQNPELYQLFETTLNSLLGGETPAAVPATGSLPADQSNMNMNQDVVPPQTI